MFDPSPRIEKAAPRVDLKIKKIAATDTSTNSNSSQKNPFEKENRKEAEGDSVDIYM